MGRELTESNMKQHKRRLLALWNWTSTQGSDLTGLEKVSAERTKLLRSPFRDFPLKAKSLLYTEWSFRPLLPQQDRSRSECFRWISFDALNQVWIVWLWLRVLYNHKLDHEGPNLGLHLAFLNKKGQIYIFISYRYSSGDGIGSGILIGSASSGTK